MLKTDYYLTIIDEYGETCTTSFFAEVAVKNFLNRCRERCIEVSNVSFRVWSNDNPIRREFTLLSTTDITKVALRENLSKPPRSHWGNAMADFKTDLPTQA